MDLHIGRVSRMRTAHGMLRKPFRASTTAAQSAKKASKQLSRLRRLLDLAQTVAPDPDKFPPSDPRHPASSRGAATIAASGESCLA